MGATLDDHVDHLEFLAIGELYLEELVDRFLVVERVHDGQVNGATKIDEIGLCTVLNTLFFFHDCEKP